MKTNLLITTALTLMLSACNAANFSATKGTGAEKSASLSSEASNLSGPSDPAVTPVCNTELKRRGLKYSGGLWRKRVNAPCGYSGIGYIESEVEIDAAKDHSCDDLALLDSRLENGTGVSRVYTPDRIEALVQSQITLPGQNFRWIERSRHCAQSTRCQASQTPSTALGRLAWMKKCEATVPEFKTFLDGIRRVEDCSAPGQFGAVPGGRGAQEYGKSATCIFTSQGVTFFPVVKVNGSLTDNAPAPSVNASHTLAHIDELAGLANQVTEACPAAQQVAPIDTVCTSGCFRGDQRLLTSASGRYEAILDAKEANSPTLAVLSRASTIESPRFVNAKVARYTASQEEAKEVLLTFETASGARLVLTTNHPLLDASGVMREASSFKAGDRLVKADGGQDEIVSLTRQEFFGKVYNVAPVSIAPEDNMIVSEGLINGSHNFQTVLRSELNRQVLRDNLAKGF